MTAASPCPDAVSMQRFILGQLPEAQAESVLRHLTECQRCVQTLHDLKLNDTLLDALRQASSATIEKPLARDIEKLIERFRQVPALASRAQATRDGSGQEVSAEITVAGTDELSLGFLAPAEAPGELGRLGGYRILEVLGVGGMGIVFLAEDPHLHRRVALKAMKPGLAASKSPRERFLREARSTAAVKHDHIVTIHQVGEDRGVPFLAMELLEGESLDACLHREGKLLVAEVLRLGQQIARGLAAAHQRNLLHRDIKPANIFLEGGVVSGGVVSGPETKGRDNSPLTTHHSPTRVKILDFGLARAADDQAKLTQQGVIVGTPAYMAPEQATGAALDGRCDLFSLGCVLYRMATGKAPFRGSDAVSTLFSVAHDQPAPPHEVNSDVPRPLSDLILKLLEKKPEDRPASAWAVLEALQRIERNLADDRRIPAAVAVPSDLTAVHEPNRQAGVAPRSPGVRPFRRWLVAAAVLLALGGIGFFLGPTILRVKGGSGELVVEVDDPNLEIVVRQGKVELTDKSARRTFQLEPGNWEVLLRDGDTVVKAKQITIERGAKASFRASMEEIANARQANQKAPTDSGRRIAAWVLAHKGTILVTTEKNANVPTISAPDQLPKEQFLIKEISFFMPGVAVSASTQTKEFQEEMIGILRDLNGLETLDLRHCSVDDFGLGRLASLPLSAKLKSLYLGQTRVSDAGLANLARFPILTRLSLDDNREITDVGLKNLGTLDQLESLSIGNAKVTDSGLAELGGLKVTSLGLYSLPHVTDAGMRHVAELKELKTLYCILPITGAGLQGLKKSPALKSLRLHEAKLSDSDLARLRGFTRLEELYLQRAPITDAGLENLRDLKRLTDLGLLETKISAAGAKMIANALPACRITSDHGVIEPGKSSQPPDLEKPFIVIRGDAGTKEGFKHLTEALATYQKGDAIEVHGNGPFAIGATEIGDKGLTLRGGAGYRPRFVARNTVLPNVNLFTINGPLDFEGCDFQSDVSLGSVFYGAGSHWKIRNCRFFAEAGDFLVFSGQKLSVADCLVALRIHSGTVVRLSGEAEIDLTNNLVLSTHHLVGTDGTAKQIIHLNGNTFTGVAIVWAHGKELQALEIHAHGNVFQTFYGFLTWMPQFKGNVHWLGSNNLYAVHPTYSGAALHWVEAPDVKVLVKSLSEWNQFWGKPEQGSMEANNVSFQWQAVEKAAKANEAMTAMQRTLLDLRLRHGMPKLGPDCDLLGPGDAALRARVPIEKDQLRPTGTEDGPFVILRNDQVFKGFPSLEKSLAAAVNADIIEIRGDGPYAAAHIQGNAGRTLTIRSAPGYHPILEGAMTFTSNDVLTVEGIHLRKGTFGNPSFAFRAGESRVARCAHCIFEDGIDPFFPETRAGKPGEISHCWVGKRVQPMVKEGSQLRISHSVMGDLRALLGGGKSRIELDRCVLWPQSASSIITVDVPTEGNPASKVTLSAKDTLFEGPLLSLCELLVHGQIAWIEEWKGEGNLYHIGPGAWFLADINKSTESGIATLKRRWHSSEAGSVEEHPLNYDPQQWRLLSGSPGYRANKGKDFGADVDRLHRAVDPLSDSERRLALWVLAHGGEVVLNEARNARISQGSGLPAGPFQLWEVSIMGPHAAHHLHESDLKKLTEARGLSVLNLMFFPLTDGGLRQLLSQPELAKLKRLNLMATRITNESLKDIRQLPHLEELVIDSTAVDDDGLALLLESRFIISNLRDLKLGGTSVGNLGLAKLVTLGNLEVLSVLETLVTDEGLDHVAKLRNLRRLFLDGDPITGAGLAKLSGLVRLEYLWLSRTKIVDKDLSLLASFDHLIDLHLSGTTLTDAGLEHLKRLGRLQTVNLRQTRVTAAGVKALAAALPRCQILSDHGTIEAREK